MGTTLRDLKYTLRSLRRSPGFALTAIATLALGIGAATSVFSVANGVLLTPLPYSEPGRVVTVWASWDNFPDKTWISVPEYQLFHQNNRTLQDLGLYGTSAVNFTAVANPERVAASFLTPNTFELLGVPPTIGRTFSWEEARQGIAGVVLSHDAWIRRYGGDPSIVTRSVELDGELVPVRGVMPEGFALPVDLAGTDPSQVYLPLYIDVESPAPDLGSGGSHSFFGVGRLRPGVTVADTRSDFERMMATVEPVGLYSEARRFAPRVYSAPADVVGTARATILVLLGAVGFLLLVACGNVANLMLSRSEARAGEIAVRTALGAGRARILRQLLTESMVLALIAGVFGVLIAVYGIDALLAIDPSAVPRSASVVLDVRVGLFAIAACTVTAVGCGLLPALQVLRTGLNSRLRSAGRGAGPVRLQGGLIATQMAMTVILLTVSGLMMRSFVGLLGVDPGFSPAEVLTARVTAPEARYAGATDVADFYSRALTDIEGIPGVTSAAAARLLPLASTMGDALFRPVGYQPGPNESTQADWQWATPDYFETLGIHLIEGRTFERIDARNGQAVVIINETLARRYWGTQSPVGSSVLASGALDTAIVVGVVGDIRHNGITAEVNERYYVPHAQVHESRLGTMRSMTLTIGTEQDAGGFVEPVRARLQALDPSMPVSEIRTMDEVLSGALAQPRFAMVLLGSFAALALVLAVVGTYGVVAHMVGRRTREIGVRMALGAEPSRIVGLVVRQSFLMALLGVGVGAGLAWTLSGAMSSLLYGVAARDAVTFVTAPTVLLAIALLAALLPAWRAIRVRPSAALRYD